jgi:hypothetical protein
MAGAREETAGTYVYGVMRSDAQPAIASAGVEGQPVGLVTSGGLAAIVSGAPPGEVRGSRRNLMAHTHVLQEAVAETCVLPMRFGVVMPSEDAVREELLEAFEERLGEQLEAFGRLVELDLKLLCPADDLLRAAVDERPEIRQRRARLEGRPADATYYERIELGEMVAGAVAARREQLTAALLDRLAPLAVDTSVGEPLHDHMVASVALLVERDRVPQVDSAVETAERELPRECSFRYVGPLPPYSFTGLDSEGEARTWA